MRSLTRPDGTIYRGTCPGCGRDDVPLLPPRAAGRFSARPWRRKDHAATGSLEAGASRCRYTPKDLTDEEITELHLEDPCPD